MSAFASIGVYNRQEDWIIAAVALLVCYLFIYPLIVYVKRKRYTNRIKDQTVTTSYKLPIDLAPVELSYIFSTSVTQSHVYATLLHLANRSILHLEKKHGEIFISMGPKVEKNLKSFEKMLVGYVNSAGGKVTFSELTRGTTTYGLSDGTKINGSRQYILWWLIRETLRKRKIINRHMHSTYTRMLVTFAVVGSLIVSVVPLMAVRFTQLLVDGQIDFDRIMDTFFSGFSFWFIAIIPVVLASFFILRYRGRMLGRDWLLAKEYKRYLGQIDAFREFVRLTHKNSLDFDSKELHEQAKAQTRPYAIACGFIKKF